MFTLRLPGVLALGSLLTASAFAQSPAQIPASVTRHTTASGDVSCALFLKGSDLPKSPSRRHILVVDTSASQVGEHRLQALAVLEALLAALPESDQVRLFAADLRAEPLDEGFQSAHSPGVARSLERLKERVPLGATNLEGVLRTVLESATDQPTDILYLGDGLSTADLLEFSELRALVGDLRRQQVPVHGYGVGARRDLQLLGILAQQTGGFVDFDTLEVVIEADPATANSRPSSPRPGKVARALRSSAERAVEQGKGLATALNAPIFFPRTLQVEPAELNLLPSDPLPIRGDRDTVYLLRGDLPGGVRITLADEDGQNLSWKAAAPVEQPGATFLPVLIEQVELQRGLTNPLAGLPLFLLAQTDFADGMTALAQQGLQALQAGNLEEASRISSLVTRRDPRNEQGKILQVTLERAREALKKKPRASGKPAP